MTAIKIYGGLSVDAPTVRRVLPRAELAPPVKRGDLAADLARGVQVIGIADGEFLQRLAVSASEIMDALRSGALVYGSSSMGAMRAAELEPFGMRGVGRIFEYVRRTKYFQDDHLGQLVFEGHGATLPLIDLRFAIEDAVAARTLRPGVGRALLRHYERRHFSERSLGELRRALAEHAELRALDRLARTRSQKRADALALLRRIDRDLTAVQRAKRAHGF